MPPLPSLPTAEDACDNTKHADHNNNINNTALSFGESSHGPGVTCLEEAGLLHALGVDGVADVALCGLVWRADVWEVMGGVWGGVGSDEGSQRGV